MLTLPYTSRDYTSIFNGIKEIIQTLEPKADVDFDKANVESIIAKIVAGCVDTLSYNQDANILEAFPSTARDPRAIFDLLSIVGYTPKTARCCHLIMSLWNPSFTEQKEYSPFNSIKIDGKVFYNPDSFTCNLNNNEPTTVDWYQGTLISPDKRPSISSTSFIGAYYPNLSVNVIDNNKYKLPENQTTIDSRTIRIYTENGEQLTYLDNPYLTNITKKSFSILPSVSSNGYSLIFSKDVSNGVQGDNLYYFYLVSDGYDVSTNSIPDFSSLASENNQKPSFSYNYSVELSHGVETAQEARENIVYEFGWRDTPKAIINIYDAERAVLQNFDIISAVDVRDGNNYSKCDSSKFQIQVFCKVNEETELLLSESTVESIKTRLRTHFDKFKMLPLDILFHIDDIKETPDENVTELYYWYPNVTIYLKEQVDAQEASAIVNEITNAIFNKFSTKNTEYNSVPRTVDIIQTIQDSSDMVLYLDIDGIGYINKTTSTEAKKTDITCSFEENITGSPNQIDFDIDLSHKDSQNIQRNIQFSTVKLVTSLNEVIGYDNGAGLIIPNTSYLAKEGHINYETGKLTFSLKSPLTDGVQLYVVYKQETPCYCEFINKPGAIQIARESIKV